MRQYERQAMKTPLISLKRRALDPSRERNATRHTHRDPHATTQNATNLRGVAPPRLHANKPRSKRLCSHREVRHRDSEGRVVGRCVLAVCPRRSGRGSPRHRLAACPLTPRPPLHRAQCVGEGTLLLCRDDPTPPPPCWRTVQMCSLHVLLRPLPLVCARPAEYVMYVCVYPSCDTM